MSTESSCQIIPPSPRVRFVRLNPRFDRDETLEIVKSEMQTDQHYDKEYPLPVPWLNSKGHKLEFFAVPEEFCLSRSSSFQSGRVYGMDVTSGAAVAALLFDLFDLGKPRHREHVENYNEAPLRVLDLCCAPGLKLCMLADLAPPSSILVGVDISPHRISLCKKIIQKYHINEATSASKQIPKMPKNNDAKNKFNRKRAISSRSTVRLYCADGTTFGTKEAKSTAKNDLVFDSNVAAEEFRSRGKRKRMNKSARAREKRRLLELQQGVSSANASSGIAALINHTGVKRKKGMTSTSMHGKLEGRGIIDATRGKGDNGRGDTLSVPSFDRVLVDAECSTDGALRHIEKRQSRSSLSHRNATWDAANMDELVGLQQGLIESGFRLLKRGGVMIYSTCSLSLNQNENVVLSLLEKHDDAFIIPVSFASLNKTSLQGIPFIEEGSIHGAIRFNPIMKEIGDERSSADCLLPCSGFFLAKIGKKTHPA